MEHTTLIIALVFAAVFGTALICLATYFIHRYIQMRCLEVKPCCLRVFVPLRWRTACHCAGIDLDLKEKSRSRSSRPRGRSKSRGRQGKPRRDARMIEAGTEWEGIGQEQEQMRRQMRALPMVSPMSTAQQYDPWHGQMQVGQQMGMAYSQPTMYPQAYPQGGMQTYPQPYAQGSPQTLPFTIPRQQKAHRAMPTASSVSSVPAHRKAPHRTRIERPESQARSRHASRDGSRVRTMNFIHIIPRSDDFPPIVKEAIEKAKREARSDLSSSSESSTSTEVEEVPRTSIPQAAPRFADPQPFQVPDLMTQVWNAPSPYPQQWNGDVGGGVAPNEQPRYAPLYSRSGGRMSRHVDVERRHHVPSITPPSVRSEPFGRHSFPRPKHTNSLRCTRDALNHDARRKGWSQSEGIGAKVEADAPDQRWSHRGRTKGDDAATTPASSQPPRDTPIPKMSPVPVPEIEEPLSGSISAKGKKPIILGMPLNSTDDARATSPSVPSPLFHIRSLSTSPLSTVSNLQEAGDKSS